MMGSAWAWPGLTGSNYIWDIVEIYPECKKLCKTSKEFETWSAHFMALEGDQVDLEKLYLEKSDDIS